MPQFIVIPREGDTFPMQIIEADACISKHHTQPVCAVAILHLVQGPSNYCAECAAGMLGVYEVLATHCHVEAIALPIKPAEADRGKRQIDLEDLQHGA